MKIRRMGLGDLGSFTAMAFSPVELLRAFHRRWILTTLLVVTGIAVMARLGVWQLDRLDQRRAFNIRVLAQISRPELSLTGETLNSDLVNMEYRPVIVRGEYDFSSQVALRNQAWEGRWGVHLLTPLHIQETDSYVLVDRGWIPGEDYLAGDWSEYDEPGIQEVRGVIRAPQSKPDIGKRRDPTPMPGERIMAWNLANVQAISQQVPHPLLPIYIQQAPDPTWKRLPARSQPELDLTEGPHLGYALQWFAFAGLLGLGYPLYIRREERRRSGVA